MQDKRCTLYNVIFPLWLVLFAPLFPLVYLPVLLVNLVIDAGVIGAALRLLKFSLPGGALRSYIFKAWLCGFLADFLGVAVLFALADSSLMAPDSILTIWNNPTTVVLHLLTIALVGALIYLANRRLGTRAGLPAAVAHKVALAMGIITAPWVFLVPTSIVPFLN
ncbi:MAG: hypothetical protein PWR31_959 [Bacillota bacterium]|nr:hypothetical protein [Bacillota bacterium]